MKPTIWFDITNVPHVNFFFPIYKRLLSISDKQQFTIRDFAETKALFDKTFGLEAQIIGAHKKKNKLLKVLGSFERIFTLNKNIGFFDVKISVGGDASSIVAKLRRKKSITFDDNEMAPNWRYSKFSDLAFWPDCIDVQKLHKQGFSDRKMYRYHGLKEDIYVADYCPDVDFLGSLPFKEYLLLRAENLQASYVSSSGIKKSLVPVLLEKLIKDGYNIVYLPRYKEDFEYVKNFGDRQLYIPEKPLNGLDACYHAHVVLTGAGTLSREAACLGIPAVSFYAGSELLTVDKELVSQKKVFFSRNPDEIRNYVKKASMDKQLPNLSNSKAIQDEVISRIKHFISEEM